MSRTYYGWSGTNQSIRVVMTDESKKWSEEVRNDAGGGGVPVGTLWESPVNVYKSKIWVEDIPAIPPGVTTSVIEAGVYYSVVLNTSSASLTFESYVVVAFGMADNDPPVGNWINPVEYGIAYMPTLEYDNMGVWTDIPATHASDWYFDFASGHLIVFNPPLPGATLRISGWRYVGRTLEDVMSGTGLISNMTVTDGTTSVTNAVNLTVAGAQFTVTDLGAGVASVGLNTAALQYSVVDDITVLAGVMTYALTTPAKIAAISQYPLIQVFVNGIRYRYGVDYSFAGISPGPVNITWISPSYTIVAGDIISIVY
jgi:hypothetical protein